MTTLPAAAQQQEWERSFTRQQLDPSVRPAPQQPAQQARRQHRREVERARPRERDARPVAVAARPEPAPVERATARPGRLSVPPAQRTVATSESTPIAAPRASIAGQAPDPLVLVISLPSQRMQVYGPTGRIMDTRVSTGKPGHATPAGIYIIQRNRHHRSNIYSGAPMPYMQRITWSGIALHAGVVPNYPASHGCIRLPNEVAPKMWALGRMGMRVIITETDVVPIEVAHPNLPAPQLTPVPVAELPTSVRTAAVGDAQPMADTRLFEPFQFAHVRKTRAAAAVQEAERAIRPAIERAQEMSAAATRAADELRQVQAMVEAVERRLAELREASTRPQQSAEQQAEIRNKVETIERELDEGRQRVAQLRVAEQAASDAAFAAARAARDAEAAAVTAAEDARRANWSAEPISVFVSRKDGRVYVRQAFNQIHEEPIDVREPDRPLGTHVFTAMESTDGGTGLRWIAVTVPSRAPEVVEAERASRNPRRGQPVAAPATPKPASDARDAIARVELPAATRQIIADRLFAGASLTISDFPASNETGRGTDFIIQPK
jgi:lipoprotein-anchoring transpeptidase ErfK/SrfK